MFMSSRTLSHYIAGEWIAPKEDNWSADINPSDTTQELARVPQGQPEIVERAIESAQTGFAVWKAKTGTERANLLHKAANVLAERRQALGTVVAQEVGKPIGEALQEVDRGVMILRYFAEEAVHPMGQVIPAQSAGSLQFSLRQPVGPVAVISPWNFPVAIPLWKISPAIAYGNTVIWKPAGVASLTAYYIAEVFAEAGLPAGVVNLVLGKGSTVGNALINSQALRAITFTGSDDTGMGIAEVAARHNIKYQLEMGGKNAVIVLDDADVVQAARLTAAGAMRYAGQKCTATSRAVVIEQIAGRFIDQLKNEIAALPVAQATEARSAVGPLITQDSLEKVASYAEIGARSGQVVLGGKRPGEESLKNGYFFEPTVITDVAPDAQVAQEEIFGPLLVVHRAKSVEDAIAIANSTKYGLSVSLFTRDINAALAYIQQIDCGMVRINGDTTGVDPHAPFGGMRSSSSHSREQGTAAIEFFTEIKTVQLNPAGV
jgi:acyl-CoA reductase-like NAD-dependent aldehyde dehydrogenase